MGLEYSPRPEPDREVVAAYATRFIPRYDMYPLQLPDGRYVTIRKRMGLNLVTAHLKGMVTIGAYALDEESRAKWICFDADDEDEWMGLRGMAACLEREHITPYVEPSRRGGHLWLFFAALAGVDVRRFGQQLLLEHGLETVELFPKQDILSTGPGSLVRLPLGRHRLTDRRYHFITTSGAPLAPTVRDQIKLLAAPARVPQAFIDQVLARAPVPVTVSPTPRFAAPPGDVAGETLSERLKNRISVYDFVSEYVELDLQGRGLCPFHDDHRKSFGVNQADNFWHCFAGCGGGSIVDFWMKWREQHGQDPSFSATIRELAQMLL
jgi:hypothetical protein